MSDIHIEIDDDRAPIPEAPPIVPAPTQAINPQAAQVVGQQPTPIVNHLQAPPVANQHVPMPPPPPGPPTEVAPTVPGRRVDMAHAPVSVIPTTAPVNPLAAAVLDPAEIPIATGPPPLLSDWFDRIFVINCQHRPDRLKEFQDHIDEMGIVKPGSIQVVKAIVGDRTTYPCSWGSGGGAWGCLQSHRRIMEDLMHDLDERGGMAWTSALILEDDAVFQPGCLEGLRNLMTVVPHSWGQIYLGGQNQKPISRMSSPHIVKCNSVNRTHAYAINPASIKQVYRHVSYMSDYHGGKHIDHQLELAHRRGDWEVYGPATWICQQRAGSSDISGQTTENDTRWT